MADVSDGRAELFRDLGGLSMRSFRDGDAHTIALAGEFDLATTAEIERELADAESSDAQILVLDLRELQFIDSSGLRVLVMAHRRQASRLMVVKGPAHVQRVFEMCGMLELLPFVDVPPDASAGAGEAALAASVRPSP